MRGISCLTPKEIKFISALPIESAGGGKLALKPVDPIKMPA
jgi:hypothetical protein